MLPWKGKLSLGELGSATCGFEAVLFTFLHSGIAGQVTSGLEDGAIFFAVQLQQSAGDAVTLSLIHI